MKIPAEGVHYDERRRKHVVVLVLDADEAYNFASGLHHSDAGRLEIEKWAVEAEKADIERAEETPTLGLVVTVEYGGCAPRGPGRAWP